MNPKIGLIRSFIRYYLFDIYLFDRMKVCKYLFTTCNFTTKLSEKSFVSFFDS